MKVLAAVQARIGSTRLPGKVLMNLGDKSVLEHVVERLKRCRQISEVVVLTTISKSDLKIVDFCSSKGIRVYCGSENDVLDRYYQAAKLFDAEQIVRITADCPLIDPEVTDLTIEKHFDTDSDYTYNDNYPDGLDVEVIKFSVLKTAWQKAKLVSEREHVTSFIRNYQDQFKINYIKYQRNLLSKRWTLDEKDDYLFLEKIFDNVYSLKSDFTMDDVLVYLEENPEVEKINNHIIHNEGFIKSCENDRILSVNEEL